MPRKNRAQSNKLSVRTIAAKKKALRAIEMRSEGLTFREIARELQYNSVQSAHDAVSRGLQEMMREPLETMVELELGRLDRMWQIHYLNAQAGDVQALASCLRIMERRARLMGLDAPARSEVKNDMNIQGEAQVHIYIPDNGRDNAPGD